MKKFEYMQVNMTHANMLKYLDQYGEQGWCVVYLQCHKPMNPILDNTVFTVTLAREKEGVRTTNTN